MVIVQLCLNIMYLNGRCLDKSKTRLSKLWHKCVIPAIPTVKQNKIFLYHAEIKLNKNVIYLEGDDFIWKTSPNWFKDQEILSGPCRKIHEVHAEARKTFSVCAECGRRILKFPVQSKKWLHWRKKQIKFIHKVHPFSAQQVTQLFNPLKQALGSKIEELWIPINLLYEYDFQWMSNVIYKVYLPVSVFILVYVWMTTRHVSFYCLFQFLGRAAKFKS